MDAAELAEMSRILNEDDAEAWGERDKEHIEEGSRFRQTQTVFPHQVKGLRMVFEA